VGAKQSRSDKSTVVSQVERTDRQLSQLEGQHNENQLDGCNIDYVLPIVIIDDNKRIVI